MKVTVDVRMPTWLKRPLTWRVRGAIAVIALLTVAVPAAWASHQFGDVPNGQQFHAQIDAIADAGITTGCGGGNYCPDEFVRRDAMAAFMHRGFGRVTRRTVGQITLSGADQSIGSMSFTPGLPAGALPGAAGFVQASGYVQLHTSSASGCPCVLEGHARLDDSPMVTRTFIQTVPAGGETWVTLPITGADPVTTPGVHTVNVVASETGTSTWTANAELVASYFPFGGAGGNVLGTPASDQPEGAGTVPRP